MFGKQLKNDAPRGLTNTAGGVRTICNKCGVYLKNSKWRNITTFLSTSNSWYDGFECIRCMDRSVLSKDRFVRKIKKSTANPNGEIIVKRPPRYSYYCKKTYSKP
jgi:hypothetical protein